MKLCELAMKYGTDKCPHHKGLRPGHSYTPFYHELFSPIRDKVRTLLEIGIETGASLRMWRDYFPNATIIGVDNRPETAIDEERITSIICDAADLDKHDIDGLDVVIDDGDHNPQHQADAFDLLFPKLSRHGIYVIEDVKNFGVICGPSVEEVEFDENFPTQDDRLIVVRT